MNIIIEGELIEFDWDEGNYRKNWIKHKVSLQEAEEAFADESKVVFLDIKHLDIEKRYFLLARTYDRRLLAIAYTQRGEKIRVISARDASKREVRIYEEATNSSEIQR